MSRPRVRMWSISPAMTPLTSSARPIFRKIVVNPDRAGRGRAAHASQNAGADRLVLEVREAPQHDSPPVLGPARPLGVLFRNVKRLIVIAAIAATSLIGGFVVAVQVRDNFYQCDYTPGPGVLLCIPKLSPAVFLFATLVTATLLSLVAYRLKRTWSRE